MFGLNKTGRRALFIIITAFCILPIGVLASESADTPTWATPSAMSLKQIGQAFTPARFTTSSAENLNCLLGSYPYVTNDVPRQGCFVTTAYGELDVENNLLVLAGTSGKVMPVHPYSPNHALVPWPHTNDVLALSILNTGGVNIGIHSGFSYNLSDQRDLMGRTVAKRVVAPPQNWLIDQFGQNAVFNSNTLAFSDNGSWIIGETRKGTFIRINLATRSVLPFAPSFISSGNAPRLDESQLTISNDGRFVAVSNSTAQSFRIYDLSECKPSENACSSFNYWPFIKSQIPTSTHLSSLRFINQGLLSFESTTGQQRTKYVMAPRAVIDSSIDYLALGDSFASGEGAGDYRSGTNTESNTCHSSNNSYSSLIIYELFGSNGGNSVACAGARMNDIIPRKSSSYEGQMKGSEGQLPPSASNVFAAFLPGYLPQADFVSKYQPRIIAAEIGGNDIGFGQIVSECAGPHTNRSNTCYETYEDRVELARLIDRKTVDLEKLYTKLRNRAPLSRLYVLGYPQLAVNGDCGINVRLDESEIKFANQLVAHLNAGISEAARRSGVVYIDVETAFAGHRLCENSGDLLAVNGLTAGTDSGPKITTKYGQVKLSVINGDSYHPNVLGHRLLKSAILWQTNNFNAQQPSSKTYAPAVNDTTGILAMPQTGRSTSVVEFGSFTEQKALAGESIYINLEGQRPNTKYIVLLAGAATGKELTTDITGTLSGQITLPTTLVPGPQRIDIIGPNVAGESTAIRQVIQIVSVISAPEPISPTITSTVPITSVRNDGGGVMSIALLGNNSPPSHPLVELRGKVRESQYLGSATASPSTGQRIVSPQGSGSSTFKGWQVVTTLDWLPWVLLFVTLVLVILLLRHIEEKFRAKQRFTFAT